MISKHSQFSQDLADSNSLLAAVRERAPLAVWKRAVQDVQDLRDTNVTLSAAEGGDKTDHMAYHGHDFHGAWEDCSPDEWRLLRRRRGCALAGAGVTCCDATGQTNFTTPLLKQCFVSTHTFAGTQSSALTPALIPAEI